jgi:hypothetical protein
VPIATTITTTRTTGEGGCARQAPANARLPFRDLVRVEPHGQPDSPVSVSACQGDAGGFAIEVTNLGGWKEPPPGHGGGGLAMMTELMLELEIETNTRVRMLSR